jgi:cobalt/nickel transport system permease protein
VRHFCRQHNEHAVVAAVDPRVRLLAAVLLLALVVSSSGSAFPWMVTGICLPMTMIAGMQPRLLMLRLLHPLFIAAVILALKTFLGGGDTFILQVSGNLFLTIYRTGLHDGMVIVSRILGAVSVALLLGQIMAFTDTMAALAWLRVPRGLVEVTLFAWRSLFMLYDDAGVVYTAQKNRLGYCGLRRGLRSFGTMAGMLVIRAFDSSDAMTVAMMQRGYDGTLPLLKGSRLSVVQLAWLLAFAVVATTAWTLQNGS